MPKYKTEPMTEEQYAHINALFFMMEEKKSIAGRVENLMARDSYDKYLEQCRTTRLKKAYRKTLQGE